MVQERKYRDETVRENQIEENVEEFNPVFYEKDKVGNPGRGSYAFAPEGSLRAAFLTTV